MPAREPLGAVKAVPEGPNNPVSQEQTVVLEQLVEDDVEREDLAVVYVVSDLPAD